MPRNNRPRHGGQRTKRRDTTSVVQSPVAVSCVTGKTGFPQHIAQAKLEAYSGPSARFKAPTRIYHGDCCGYWHLTSQEEYS